MADSMADLNVKVVDSIASLSSLSLSLCLSLSADRVVVACDHCVALCYYSPFSG